MRDASILIALRSFYQSYMTTVHPNSNDCCEYGT